MTQKKSKYFNKKTGQFASKKEAKRAAELELLQKAGKISHLQFQFRFELLPAQKNWLGKMVERAVYYVADASYYDIEKGIFVAEDVKGYRTPVYILKRKMFLHRYGYSITEV